MMNQADPRDREGDNEGRNGGEGTGEKEQRNEEEYVNARKKSGEQLEFGFRISGGKKKRNKLASKNNRR
jgi:hypothetical protein